MDRQELGEVQVWTVRLDEAPACAAAELSEEEQDRASRLRFASDRRRFKGAHRALRAILARHLGIPAGDVAFRTDTNGKPELDARLHRQPPRFNLSHSGELAVIAVSLRKVGIDVEHLARPLDADAIVRRFFSRDEARAYFALPPSQRKKAFFHAWTLKEAYLKGCGDGLRRRLDRVCVTMHPDEAPRLLRASDRPDDTGRWSLARLALPRSYIGAVAVNTG